MVKPRTPRPRYFEHGTVEFYTKNNELYYRVLIWSNDGLNLSLIEQNSLGKKTPDEIANEVKNELIKVEGDQQKFSTVKESKE